MNRITAAIVTVLVALSGLVATTSTATAAAAAAASQSAAAPSRSITIKFDQTSGSFKLTGKVSPKGARKPVALQLKKSGEWTAFRKGKTSANGHYAFRKLARAGQFRVKVVASKGYATSYSKIMKVTKG